MASSMTPAIANPMPVIQCSSRLSVAGRGAVVETVNVVCPLPVSDGGLKLQVLSLGRPEHDEDVKLMVLL